MLGEYGIKSTSSWMIRVAAGAVLIGLMLVVGQSQVVIVPSKMRPSKSSGKTKPRSKSRPAVVSATPPTPERPQETALNSISMIQPMAFVVVPPKLPGSSNADFRMLTGMGTSIARLINYSFDVLTADDRGRQMERRKENSRYFQEGLSSGIQLEMVEVPGGAFLMGNVESDSEESKRVYVHGVEREIRDSLVKRRQWEAPQHMVKVSAFYMSKFEITQAQWRAVASLPKVYRELVSDPSHFKGGNRPVEMVSWEDAVEFCERLSRATGRRYRLPTEAEWEYACRAGTNTQFHFGDSITTEWANYQGKQPYGSSPKGTYRQQTLPVGTPGLANAFGLHDMHGNVWEWCLDTWHDNYQASPNDGRAWENGGILYLKVLRGGSWDSSAAECRSASRNRMTSTMRLNNIGFRVVIEVFDQLANR